MELISSWEDIVTNIHAFNLIREDKIGLAYKHFGLFYHWYYLPEEELFGPSKFIGYKNTTLHNYTGKDYYTGKDHRTGGKTQKMLEKYFVKLPKTSSKYGELKLQLEGFAQNIGKSISIRIENQGGIHYPLPEYAFLSTTSEDLISLQYEENSKVQLLEGAQSERLVNVYERNPHLRSIALDIHGLSCMACGFNFEEVYGEHGKHFIEVHHIIPLSQSEEEHDVNPETDMIVVCSNCHRMIHRKRNSPLSIEDLQGLLNKNETG